MGLFHNDNSNNNYDTNNAYNNADNKNSQQQEKKTNIVTFLVHGRTFQISKSNLFKYPETWLTSAVSNFEDFNKKQQIGQLHAISELEYVSYPHSLWQKSFSLSRKLEFIVIFF